MESTGPPRAVRDTNGLREALERSDRQQHRVEEDHRREQRQSDTAEALPDVGAIDRGRLVVRSPESGAARRGRSPSMRRTSRHGARSPSAAPRWDWLTQPLPAMPNSANMSLNTPRSPKTCFQRRPIPTLAADQRRHVEQRTIDREPARPAVERMSAMVSEKIKHQGHRPADIGQRDPDRLDEATIAKELDVVVHADPWGALSTL